MRIWHQSFTVLDDVPHYRDALATAPEQGGRPGHRDRPARDEARHLPERLPGHPHQVRLPLRAAQGAVRPCRAAARRTRGTTPSSSRRSPTPATRSAAPLVDIPVVAFGQTSVLMAATLGRRVGIVNFIGALEPQLRRNLRNYGLDQLVGPIRQVAAEFTDVMAAYADPERTARRVPRRGPRGHQRRGDGDRARARGRSTSSSPTTGSAGSTTSPSSTRSAPPPGRRAARPASTARPASSRPGAASTTRSPRASCSTAARDFYGVTAALDR